MKFAMTHTEKDQPLNMNTNPAGELSDAELDAVFGGFCGGNFCYNNVYQHNESFGLICELNIFSVSAVSNIALLGRVTQACIKG